LPKKIQVDELCGQYKLVKKFFEDLNSFIKLKDKLEQQIAADKVKIDGREEV
jgi:hypothetical protein